jgi:phosphoribosylanthranilate isomerase
MRIRVKVCGITNFDDAVRALDLGADALGFNFYRPSPRYIEPRNARSIIERLPPLATTVGVFANVEHPADLESAARAAGVQVLQLHGNESPDYCRCLSAWPLIKAIRVGPEGIREKLGDFPVRAFLLDARDDVLLGGTGKTWNWEKTLLATGGLRVILAGGLNSENVAEAIRIVCPYAVDVCSGVEASPGKKDINKLSAFMCEVFHAAS